jgi:hypothetical protein
MVSFPCAWAHLPISARTYEIAQIYEGLFRSEISIVYPILGLPAFLHPGDDLHLGVVLRNPVQGVWEVEISLHGRRVILPVSSSSMEDGIHILATVVPKNATCGLYDVHVRKGQVRDVEEHALSIGAAKDHLTLVHITDTHMDAGSFRDQTAQRVIHSIDVINLIQPDLVVITGDITTGPPVVEEDARSFAELIVHNLQVPIYFTPGNHDARLPSDPGVGYYAFMNPYPDYAFTFGPVRFISLDHKWEMVGGGALQSSFTQEQLVFLGDELSGTEMNLTTVMFHDHWRAFGLDDYDFTLALAGHNHNNLAYRLHAGSLLLVTGAPPRTDDMIRVIEFGEDRILSCSYHADDLASAIPTRLVGVEVTPATGGESYQRLVVENGLDVGLHDACWTFNLTGLGEEWKPLVLGGSLDSIMATTQSTYCRARFDLPPMFKHTVECFSLIPATSQAAANLSRMIDEGVAVAESLKSFVVENAASFGDELEDALDSLLNARMALDEGNWTLGGILFWRATHIIKPIQLLAQSLRDVESEIRIREAQGMDTSLTDGWIQEAFLLLAQQGLHPSLMDVRKETPTPLDQMARIPNLDEAG